MVPILPRHGIALPTPFDYLTSALAYALMASKSSHNLDTVFLRCAFANPAPFAYELNPHSHVKPDGGRDLV